MLTDPAWHLRWRAAHASCWAAPRGSPRNTSSTYRSARREPQRSITTHWKHWRNGQGDRTRSQHHEPDLARLRIEAASRGDFQPVSRTTAGAESTRHEPKLQVASAGARSSELPHSEWAFLRELAVLCRHEMKLSTTRSGGKASHCRRSVTLTNFLLDFPFTTIQIGHTLKIR